MSQISRELDFEQPKIMGYEDVWMREVTIGLRGVQLYIYIYIIGYYKMTFAYRFAGQLSG